MTTMPSQVSEVQIRLIANGTDGLIAYASCRYGDVLLNDIAIRRETSGRLFLTYPRKQGSSGRPHPQYYPIDRDTAAQFDLAILGQLRSLVDGGEGSPGQGSCRP